MTAEGTAVISAHRLLLREWTPADLPVLRALFDDPDVAYRIPLAAPFDAAAARACLDANAASVAVARSAGYRRAAVAAETVTDKGRTYELLTWEHLAPAG
ncbi:hypothetical protein ACPCIU_22525 [Streptomyces seoulensis]|uniref:hypothetical protein n=1 Tax=Streptomyces seoulensis TaxID=73044 RepID=UPI003C2DCFA3